jgi:HEAT repeat protein
MGTYYNLIEWLSSIIARIESNIISVTVIRSTNDTLLVSLTSPLVLSDNRIGVRKYVIYAINKYGKDICASDISDVFEDFQMQFGIINKFLISSSNLYDDAKELIEKLGLRYVKLMGTEQGWPTKPEMVKNFADLLLGHIFIEDYLKNIYDFEIRPENSVKGEESIDNLRNSYRFITTLCILEEEILANIRRPRNIISQSSDGGTCQVSINYAILTERTKDDSIIEYYFPDSDSLHQILKKISNTYINLLHLNVPESLNLTLELLKNVSLLLIRYYASWLNGQQEKIDISSLSSQFNNLRKHPHIDLILGDLINLEPLEQIDALNYISLIGARDAIQDILKVLSNSNPKVQEISLQTLEKLGQYYDLDQVCEYIFDPRESIRKAALSLIGGMGSDNAADFLISSLMQKKLPLSNEVLYAISRLGTTASLGFLLTICTQVRGNTVLIALEECLHHFAPDGFDMTNKLTIDEEKLLSICITLFAAEDQKILSQRVALKLISVFKLQDGRFILEQALQSEKLRIKFWAIKAASNFQDDIMANAIISSFSIKSENPSSDKLLEWIESAFDPSEGLHGKFKSLDQLNLEVVAVQSLRKIGTEIALKYADEITQANPDLFNPIVKREIHNFSSLPMVNSIANKNTIYSTPNNVIIWLDGLDENSNDPKSVVMVSIIHNNKVGSCLNQDFANSMLGGGLSTTMGQRDQIMRDVVHPLQNGLEPKLPNSVGMGESKTFDWSNTSTQISSQNIESESASKENNGEI